MIVYLSGGLHSGWQDELTEAIAGIEFLDPRYHGLEHDENQYTLWDLLAIRSCDIVFVYFEETNPSGIGLSAEMGYAKALGKTIIYVDPTDDKKRGFLRAIADVHAKTLDEGMALLIALS